MKAKKIAKILEEKYTSKVIDLEELNTFIETEFKPNDFFIENDSKRAKKYSIKISMVFDKKLMEFYIQPL